MSMANSPYQRPGVVYGDDGHNAAGVGAYRDVGGPQVMPSPHPSVYADMAPAQTPYTTASYLDPNGGGGYVPQRTPSMHSRAPSPAQAPMFDRYEDGAMYNEQPPPPPPGAMVAPYAPAVAYAPGEKTPYLRAYERRRKRAWCFLGGLVALAIVVLAIVLPVYFAVIRPKNHGTSTNDTGGAPQPTSPASGDSTSGGNTTTDGQGNSFIIGVDGTTVTTSDGSTFVYRNPFGGYFVHDEKNPYNSGARAQSWTPALNESWTWGVDKVRGVNLGGWFVPEPFIAPQLYQKYLANSTITGDEWTLSEAMAADTGSGGIGQLETHYKTFITEEDFAQIAGAGLNHVRIPIPFWAVETWPGEPFLERTSWSYIVQAFEWARKYGLRINLDLHTVPGAANPWNHSGRSGVVNFMEGVMGYANAQRGLGYIRYITEFISQPQYANVVTMFGIVNEPQADLDALKNFYLHAHDMIRGITGFGTGKGPYISIHDQFKGPDAWAGFAAGADRMALEQHPYFAFGSGNAPDITPFLNRACTDWSPALNQSQSAFGVTTAGEWSLGFNDCGLYVNGIGDSHATKDCAAWDDWQNYSDLQKTQLRTLALSQMDALPHWFFWTWKISPDQTGIVRTPLWSYQLGLQNGWIPTNPRDADGVCNGAGGTQAPYQPWMTGGTGAGTLLGTTPVWPPTSIPGLDVATGWPTYTATAPVITMPGIKDGGVADGWANDADSAPGITTVSGCAYPDEYRPDDVIPPLCPAPTAGNPAPVATAPPNGVPVIPPP